MEQQSSQNKKRILRSAGLAVMALLCVLALVGAAWGWLSYERGVVAVAPVKAPMSIYIRAGGSNETADPDKYIDMSGIDVSKQSPENYKDFVFAVQGAYANAYRIQLAYTTNNQFEYALYPAIEVVNPQSEDEYTVEYVSTEQNATYYYKPGTAEISMPKLNASSANSRIAEGSPDSYYSDTYGDYAANSSLIDQYAVPIYRKTADLRMVEPAMKPFIHYYILRVTWPEPRTPDRETDILYISAKLENQDANP